MTPASRLPVEPGDRVLDVCAAPGGKATELGAKLQGTGILAANDLSSSRAKGLLKNLELFGIGNVLVLSEEPGKLVSYFEGYFDKILIDAPCSGEGMFRKDKKMVKAWEEHGPSFFSKIQKSIITQAAQMLRPGGMLLYSTCTFSPEENEQTIEYLLQEYPEFQICEMEGYEGFVNGMPQVTESRNEELKKTVRIFPHRMKGEGHFLALLQKGEAHPALPSGTDTGKPKKLPEGKPCRFTAPDGTVIEVGKNSLQNDRLTLHARGGETWLHAQGIPGSHVLIRTESEPSDETLLYAAKLAAYFSKGRNHPQLPVDYTRRKYVKKSANAPAGLVTYTNFKTLIIGLTPEDVAHIIQEGGGGR